MNNQKTLPPEIRIGNDIPLVWSFFVPDPVNPWNVPYNLTSMALSLYLVKGQSETRITDYTVSGNSLSWTFKGSSQSELGTYSLTLKANEGQTGQCVVDIVDFVRLIPRGASAGNSIMRGSSSCLTVGPAINLQTAVDWPYETKAHANQELAKKVDKITGKGLSTNDYTNEDKQKVQSSLTEHQSLAEYRKATAQDVIDNNKVNKVAGKGLSSNDLTNELKALIESALQPSDITSFITKSVNDLVNYYRKTETYTREEVDSLVGAISSFSYSIVATLPATGEGNILYLLGPSGSGSDRYEEYVYSAGSWVRIGDTSIDLSGYVTTAALNALLSGYVTSSVLAAALGNFYTKAQVNSLVETTVKTALPATLEAGNIYDLGARSQLNLVLPSSGQPGDWIIVDFISGAVATSLSVDAECGVSRYYNADIDANTSYEYAFSWIKLPSGNYGWGVTVSSFTDSENN